MYASTGCVLYALSTPTCSTRRLAMLHSRYLPQLTTQHTLGKQHNTSVLYLHDKDLTKHACSTNRTYLWQTAQPSVP
jgi:hypothetical protein